jgi:hypothetical protein
MEIKTMNDLKVKVKTLGDIIDSFRDYVEEILEKNQPQTNLLITKAREEKWVRLEELKQKLRDKCVRLLMLRAGGRYKMFEAGMLYQCLLLLGMKEYSRHKQVDALEKITCHFFHENDAKKQLEELLKEKEVK